MTYPVFTGTHSQITASAQTTASVSSAPALHYAGGSLQPDSVHVQYVYDLAEGRWAHSASVSGPRYLMNGKLGRTRVTRTFWHAERGTPQWLTAFIAEHAPCAVPHIPVVTP